MRSAAVLAAVLAAGVLAQPLEQKRDVVVVETQVDVVYTTVVVDSYGQPVPAPTPVVVASKKHHKVHKHHAHHKQAPAPAPAAAAPSVPKVAPAPQIHDATSYAGVGVQQHNFHRQNHSAPAVTWDANLASSAAALAAGCVFEHNVSLGPASSYGQNIASSYPATGSMADELKQVITSMWYNGEVNNFANLYGQEAPNMSNFDSWGHFTQVVWAGSTAIGCATQTCPTLGYFTVCNYGPAGNMIGAFAQNVHRSIGEPSIAG